MQLITDSSSDEPLRAEWRESALPEKRVWSACWLVLALLLFLVQTLPYLSYRWVTDESWYSATAYSLAGGHGFANPAIGPNDIENHFDTRPPGTAIIIAAAFRMFGTSQISARIGSVIAGLLVVLFTYVLARDLAGPIGARVASFIIATDSLLILCSHTARPETFTTLFVLAALWALNRYSKKGTLAWAFACGLLMALGTMFHITLAGFLISIGILLIFLDYRSSRFLLHGSLAYACAFLIGLAPFAIWILKSPLGNTAFHQEYLNRVASGPLWQRFLDEGHRYANFFGMNILQSTQLSRLPLRLPLILYYVIAIFLLWKLQTRRFYLVLVLLLPSMLWFSYTVNKSTRYLVLLAPVLAFAIGAAAAYTGNNRRLQNAVVAFAVLAVAAQATSNFVLLYSARKADYDLVANELRSAIPPGEPAYGTITFWLTFHDRPFICYERTDPFIAANTYHVRYFITGDRVMARNLQYDPDFYVQLQKRMMQLEARSTTIATFQDPYYGDLRVLKLSDY
jgi:4-amino-4-deoxy-L-arabinose transferase-like glycosyltransferase